MAIAVLDLEFERLPTTITGLDRYNNALVLIRLRGRPVGQVLLPVVDGRINGTELRDAVANVKGWPLWEKMLHDFLDWEVRVWPDRLSATATVAVCTRDRPEDIKRCLEALIALPDDGQELLVIDNCPSTDATQRIVATYGERVRYVREERPGLNVARNRALREAKHDIIAFNDDDAIPDPNWLRALLKNFSDPSVLCVTGLTMPLELETEAQEWFERYSPFGRGFQRIFFYGNLENAMVAGRVGAGANMAVRRSLLQKVGPFDEVLDAGTPTRSGGDTEMFIRILASGYHIIYDPAALTWHRHRRTWTELRLTAYGYGVGIYAVWMRTLLNERTLSVLAAAAKHFGYYQLPILVRSLARRHNRIPLGLVLAELWGCVVGVRAYFVSRRRLQLTEK